MIHNTIRSLCYGLSCGRYDARERRPRSLTAAGEGADAIPLVRKHLIRMGARAWLENDSFFAVGGLTVASDGVCFMTPSVAYATDGIMGAWGLRVSLATV